MAYNPPTYGESGEVYTDNVRNSLEAVKATADAASIKAAANEASIVTTTQTADEAKELAAEAKAFVATPVDSKIASLVEDSTSSTATALNAAYARIENADGTPVVGRTVTIALDAFGDVDDIVSEAI